MDVDFQAEIECHDNGDGSALVRYLPTVAGEYAIHILCDNEDISKSPFIAQIQPKSNLRPNLVKCSGPGIQTHGVILNCTTEFKIDTRDASNAGNAPIEISVGLEGYFQIDQLLMVHLFTPDSRYTRKSTAI